MKTILAILFASSFSWACPDGCEPYKDSCACAKSPTEQAEPVVASDEKPRGQRIPAWEIGEVKADMPVSLKAKDEASLAESNYKAEREQR
jgi:hypothetical protein